MSSSASILQLFKLINNPSSLDMGREWVALDDQQPPTILVYGEHLANKILRSEAYTAFNLFLYWQTVTRTPPFELSALHAFFEITPFFLEGEAHRRARRHLVPVYRRVEADFSHWLPAFTGKFLDSLGRSHAIKPTVLAADYIQSVTREMLARDVGCPSTDFPTLPSELFQFLPRKTHLQEYDSRLSTLVDFIRSRLVVSGRDGDEAWALASIVAAGQQPLTYALIYGLVNTPVGDRWDSDTLMRLSAPLSFLGRESHVDTTIGELNISKGQHLTICPFLIHQSADSKTSASTSKKSYSFGDGIHTCAGRRISLKIVETFFSVLAHRDNFQLDMNGIKPARNLVSVYN